MIAPIDGGRPRGSATPGGRDWCGEDPAVLQLLGLTVKILEGLVWLYLWMILARAHSGWANPGPGHPVARLHHQLTEPVLRPIRRRMPRMEIDGAPMVAILLIVLALEILVSLLRHAALGLR